MPAAEESTPQGFYDGLAENYHLIFRDWWDAVEYNGSVLGSVLAGEGIHPPAEVLDVTCGIGTQALGLAQLGYQVQGSDLSGAAVARANREAVARGIRAAFSVADVRDLRGEVVGVFEVVVSCDNSLPHLLQLADLDRALHAIHSCVRQGGLFLASVRDYDAILSQAESGSLPSGTLPTIIDTSEGRRVVNQAWSWVAGEPIYDVHLFVLEECADSWCVQHHQTQHRAYRRAEIGDALNGAGFGSLKWLLPSESGYYQPIVIAQA